MSEFGWNRRTPPGTVFWDDEDGKEEFFSNREVIENPQAHRPESVIFAMCATLLEIVEHFEKWHEEE